jgi:hypothetical protein
MVKQMEHIGLSSPISWEALWEACSRCGPARQSSANLFLKVYSSSPMVLPGMTGMHADMTIVSPLYAISSF